MRESTRVTIEWRYPGAVTARVAALALCVLALVTLGGCRNALPDDAGGLPYRIEKHGAPLKGYQSCDAIDFDGDGVEEFLTFSCAPNAAYYYLSVRRQIGDSIQLTNQYNKPRLFRFAGSFDVDGSGEPEIFTSRQVDTQWAELSVLDIEMVEGNTAVRELPGASSVLLPLPDTLIGGLTWDGLVVVLDVTDGDGDGWSELVTFSVRAGLAKGPRGLGRADIRTGEMVWFTPFAGSVEEIPCVEDFDADGENEYVAAFNSPGNGVRVDDMTDSEVWVAAVDGDGSVMWRHRTGNLSAGGWPYSGDVTGDGHPEVVTWESYGRAAHPDTVWLRLWSGRAGELVSRWPSVGSINAVALGGATVPGSIFVCCEDGFVRRIIWDGRSLVCDAEIDCVETPTGIGLVRVDPVPEPILVGMTNEGTVFALDTDLRPLALLKTDEVHDCHASIQPITYATGTAGVAVGIGHEHGLLLLELTRSPIAVWIVVVVVIVAAVLLCVLVPPVRRRLLMLLRRTLVPRADREKALDELLGALVRAGHGKLAATTTLRRLTKQLTMLGGLEREPPAEFAERYREAIRDVREIGMPGVEAIHREAARIGLRTSLVTGLRRRLVSMRSLLRRIPSRPPGREECARLADLLDVGTASLDDALDGVLAGCRLELSSNVMNEIRRAAGARRSDFIEFGAELTVPTVSRMEAVRVLGTRAEVSFVIENLLGNSLAAVERSDERHVEVTVEQDDGEAVMLVSDTGTGIPPDMHERIFDDGVSGTHGGSGHGLAESRRILSKRGGAIAVVRSKPGQGTTFEVRFQIVDGGTQ